MGSEPKLPYIDELKWSLTSSRVVSYLNCGSQKSLLSTVSECQSMYRRRQLWLQSSCKAHSKDSSLANLLVTDSTRKNTNSCVWCWISPCQRATQIVQSRKRIALFSGLCLAASGRVTRRYETRLKRDLGQECYPRQSAGELWRS